ncbi:transposase%2C IS605 OrfB family [Fusobacterium polymorphum]|uniref:Possible transposase n=1 Tax=Fusobacterium polymorphum ATCC 10953 TaxID=393480 RepID=A5TVS5_FUSNP|nr:RNA-guided endonuclease TnpB family protein [Fusobacterium polymorphum]EDK89000.1 possible transposase [Fusobacterium polymorphum ATCC 10953]UTI53295.1 transposase [Fusobacterium polymorphum]WRL67817.1 transposase [Fusobacterium polymorphum]CKG66329.1 transposase%2C IS605 OrfB family [Fusobacterium polymorphum]
MYLTLKQQVKHLNKKEFRNLKYLSHIAKNLTNEAIYNIRQYYFNKKKYLSYNENYKILKNSENYKKLNSNMAQQILKEVDGSFKSFFGLLKLAKNGQYNGKIKLPNYLAKDGFTTLVIGFVRLKDDMLIVPYSNSFRKTHKEIAIKLLPVLKDKKIKEIRIIPKQHSRYFEIQYTYEVKEIQRELNKENGLGIDLGIDNLCTCVTNTGASFLIDGRKLKSINQYYNKINAKLQSIKDKQKIERTTLRQKRITKKRNNRINDYLSKAARIIINYCLNNDIGKLVLGYNEDFQRKSNIGSINNQNFVNIPYGKLRDKLIYLCKLYGIEFKLQEESYTSKASFFDGDKIPIYDKENPQEYIFSGKRIKRGLYQTSTGKIINADCNGALNILRKSKVVDLSVLYNRGELNTPKRIRVV